MSEEIKEIAPQEIQVRPKDKYINYLGETYKERLLVQFKHEKELYHFLQVFFVMQKELESSDPKRCVLRCSKESLLASLVKAASLRLPLTSVYPPYYFKNINNKCVLHISYHGRKMLAKRDMEALDIFADVVRQGDDFRFYMQDGIQHIYHNVNDVVYDKNLDENNKNINNRSIIGAWSLARFSDGRFHAIKLNRNEIDKIRSMSNAKKGDVPWNMWEDEMIKKSAINRLCKELGVNVYEDDNHAESETKQLVDYNNNKTQQLIERLKDDNK